MPMGTYTMCIIARDIVHNDLHRDCGTPLGNDDEIGGGGRRRGEDKERPITDV